jgi:hypothetical protein
VRHSQSRFSEAWAHAEPIEGWLTRPQAEVLFESVQMLPPASTVVEIGSHRGRSTLVLAAALPARGRLVAVDPFDAQWRYGGPDTQRALEEHLAAAGLADRVEVRATTSRAARSTYTGPVDLLYIDGKHDYWTFRDDLLWADLTPPGGTVLVHDAFSSVGVTLGLLRTLLVSPSLTYAGRTGSLARLRKGPPTMRARMRVIAQLPWCVRNLVVKVLLRLRLRSMARMVGHRGAADPF